jgi:hypothetical protein
VKAGGYDYACLLPVLQGAYLRKVATVELPHQLRRRRL